MTNTDMHIKAFSTNFEMACEFGALTILADILWLLHDISVVGMSFGYGVVGVLLTIGLIGTLRVLYNHHRLYIHRKSTVRGK